MILVIINALNWISIPDTILLTSDQNCKAEDDR